MVNKCTVSWLCDWIGCRSDGSAARAPSGAELEESLTKVLNKLLEPDGFRKVMGDDFLKKMKEDIESTPFHWPQTMDDG